MATSLFRSEAIEHHRAKVWGETTLPVPISLSLTTCFLGGCVLAIGIFLGEASYTRKEHVTGFLLPKRGVVRILPPRSGTIVAVHVTDGALVKLGDPLMSVSAERATDHGENVNATVLVSLRQQADRLREQVALEQRRAAAEQSNIQITIDDISLVLAALDKEHRLQLVRSEMAGRELSALTGLAQRGDMALVELRRRQDTFLAQQQSESTMARALLDKQSELDQQRNSMTQLPITSAARIAQLQASIADIATRIAQTEGERAYLLTAPVAGRVSALQAWVGKVADPAIPQMSIVPEGDTLQAELLVPARAIGFIAPGQRVRLGYDTYPYQQFGFADGRVAIVSHTLLKPGEIVGPIAFEVPSYRVTVTLARQSIRAYGKEMALQTDTQLEADVLLDSRSLIAWILDPLGKLWGRA